MCDTVNISQNAGFGAKENTFIGKQYNHMGLSPADATEMAFAIFKEYFPQFRQDALKEVHTIVENELRKIPATDIQRPSAKIAVPLLQNASITEEPELREMYGKLLSGDMNKQKKSSVHPAYVEIINQMSSDDAKLFRRIAEINNSIPVASVRFVFGTSYLTNIMPHYFSPFFTGWDPWKVSMCIENLSRLTVFHFFEGTVNNYDYERIKQEAFVTERFEFAKKSNPSRELSIKITSYVIQMNDFGRGLARLCF